MAIRREFRKYYGPEWQAFRRALISLNRTCSRCGREVTKYLQVCHLSHDPRSAVVAVMCVSCHARNDAHQRWAQTRRTYAKRAGQLWLLPEIEFAASPAWMIPRRVAVAGQGSLFD